MQNTKSQNSTVFNTYIYIYIYAVTLLKWNQL